MRAEVRTGAQVVAALLGALAAITAHTEMPVQDSVAAPPAAQFPPGAGQPQVQEACGPCHAITVITSARKSEAEWERTVNAMITRGARVSDADYDLIVDYLINNFSAQ
jgi:cytochrome c5